MPSSERPSEYFRAGVGAILRRSDGLILAFERRDRPGAWQLPQGGLKRGETPEEAIRREVTEETGITPDPDRHPMRRLNPLLAYELPGELRTERLGRGQAQVWFVFDLGDDHLVPDLAGRREFARFRWTTMAELAAESIAFRRPVYETLARMLRAP